MIFKNIEIHNACHIVQLADGITWKRLPCHVCDRLELDINAPYAHETTTGVELRFVIKSGEARIRMVSVDPVLQGVVCTFHVYYGDIQGGWADHEVNCLIGNEPKEFVFRTPKNLQELRKMSTDSESGFDPSVVRVIFDRGHIKLMDISGDIMPPKTEALPKKTLLSYGSSITHGSNSIDMSHSWVSVTAHRLHMDSRNLGMPGTCAAEPSVIDYIAEEGAKGNWDIATVELGINVLSWDEKLIHERVSYAIRKIASLNPNKPVILISPLYCHDDFYGIGKAEKWRRIMEETVKELGFPNVFYKSGLELIDNMSYISADMVHPNIYGVQKISDDLTEFIQAVKAF